MFTLDEQIGWPECAEDVLYCSGGFTCCLFSRACCLTRIADVLTVIEVNNNSKHLAPSTRDTSSSYDMSISRSASPASLEKYYGDRTVAVNTRSTQLMVAVATPPIRNPEECEMLYTPWTLQWRDGPQRMVEDSESWDLCLHKDSMQSVNENSNDNKSSVSGHSSEMGEDYCANSEETVEKNRLRSCQYQSPVPGASADCVKFAQEHGDILSAAATEHSTASPRTNYGWYTCSCPEVSTNSKPISTSTPSLTRKQSLILASTVVQAVFRLQPAVQ